MISKTFYSSGNKNAIKHIINEDIYKNTNTNINASHDLVILETMKFVESQVSPEPPRGMKSDEYLYLMNNDKINNKLNIQLKDLSNIDLEELRNQ